MDVIAVEPFTAKAKDGDYRVHTFERLKIISGFGFLRLKTEQGTILHCPEEYMGTKFLSFAMFHTKYKDFPEMLEKLEPDFLSVGEMTI